MSCTKSNFIYVLGMSEDEAREKFKGMTIQEILKACPQYEGTESGLKSVLYYHGIFPAKTKRVYRRQMMNQDKYEKVVKLRESGLSFRDIAKQIGMSRQRVHQIYHQMTDSVSK